jgi:lysophospholipase L1-like esterase
MKSKLLKRAVAGIITLAMAAQFAVMVPIAANAAEYYKESFDSATSDSIVQGWAVTVKNHPAINSGGGASVTLGNDTAATIGNYELFGTGSGASGHRPIQKQFPDEAKVVQEKQVIEFDYKMQSSADRVSDFVILASSGSAQTAAGTYKGDDYILKFDQLVGNSEMVINDATLADAANTTSVASVTKGYANDTWTHVKGVMDFTQKTVTLLMTSLDGSKTYYEGVVNMGSNVQGTLGSIVVAASRQNKATIGIDNILVRDFESSDITDTYYTITYDVNGTETTESVKEGASPVSVPENPHKPGDQGGGYTFKGWNKDDDTVTLYTAEEIEAMNITAHTKFTAVFEQDASILEKMVSVEFSQKPDAVPEVPTTKGEEKNYPVSIKINGEWGNDLALPENQKGELAVKWSVAGNETDDGYITITGMDNSNPKSTSANIKLEGGVGNYYMVVKAEVTYEGETQEISFPMAILANTSKPANRIYPAGGYPVSIDDYTDSLVGYQSTRYASGNKHNPDPLLPGWNGWGSMGDATMRLAKDTDGSKYLLATSGESTGSSAYIANNIGSYNEQIIVDTKIKFGNASSAAPISLQYVTGTIHMGDDRVSVSYDGSSLGTISGVSKDTWYRLKMSFDSQERTYWYKLYDLNGQLIGESDVLPYSATTTTPNAFAICVNKVTNLSVGIKDMTIVKPTLSSFTVSSEETTVVIPEDETTASTKLTALLKDESGTDLSGTVEWSLEGNPTNVQIVPDENDSHKAVLNVVKGADTGEIVVVAENRGQKARQTIHLTGSKDNVAFINPTTSITIPFEDSVAVTYQAEVRDGQGAPISGKTMTYAMYDKTNSEEVTNLSGISLNKTTGVLTVDASAKPVTVYIRAMGTNTNDEPISKAIPVIIHGLSFDFGEEIITDDTTTVADGYTSVTKDTLYANGAGYGFVDASGIAYGKDDQDTSNLTGDHVTSAKQFVFKVDLPNGNYRIKTSVKGAILAEALENTMVIGELKHSAAKYNGADLERVEEGFEETQFDVAVVDGVLDLHFDIPYTRLAASMPEYSDITPAVSYLEISKLEQQPAAEIPTLFIIGDSTAKNKRPIVGWGDVASEYAQGKFNVVNNGNAGKSLVSYYQINNLASTLLNIKPGDYVTVQMGINSVSGEGTVFKQLLEYYVTGILQRGGIPVLLTPTPIGPIEKLAPNGTYNEATNTFNSSRGTGAFRSTIKEVAEEMNVLFLDIGQMGTDLYNSYPEETRKQTVVPEIKEREKEDGTKEKYLEGGYYTDHNHFTEAGGRAISEMTMNALIALYENAGKDVTVDNVTYEDNTVTASLTGVTGKTVNAYVAEYDANGVFVGVGLNKQAFVGDTGEITVDYTKKEESNTLKLFLWNDVMANYTEATPIQ